MISSSILLLIYFLLFSLYFTSPIDCSSFSTVDSTGEKIFLSDEFEENSLQFFNQQEIENSIQNEKYFDSSSSLSSSSLFSDSSNSDSSEKIFSIENFSHENFNEISDSNWNLLNFDEKIRLSSEFDENSPPMDISNPTFALFLTSPGCRFKFFPAAREFIANEGKFYPNLDIQYIGGDPRILFFKTLEGRSKSILDPRDFSEEELVKFLSTGMPEDYEDPIVTVKLDRLTIEEIRQLLEMYGVKKSFPRENFPELQ